MTQLFVNDIEIALGDNFSFKQIDENPIITSVGEFTLDIVISIQTGQNAMAFGMIHRLNKRNIPAEWPAAMIVNNKVSHGKAIYISNTDTTVTIQYVSGNSELLYFANQDKKIWKMDWGIESAIDSARARQSIQQTGYETNGFHFVCAPVKLNDTIVNKFTLANETGTSIPSVAFPINGVDGQIIMMPYLLHYVEKMADMFGFTMKANVLLSNDRAKCTYLLNNFNSLAYANALPDMTLSEFIEIIEDEFNVIFLVDKTKQSLEIVYRHENISSRTTIQLNNVIDAYTRNVSEESDDKLSRFKVNKFSYELPDDLYYKYHRLDDYWDLRAIFIFQGDFATLLNFLTANPDAWYNKNGGFFDNQGNYYLYADKPSQEMFSRKITSSRSVYIFNKFRPAGFGNWDNELILKMIPPVIEKGSIQLNFHPGQPDLKQFEIHYQFPQSKYDLSDASAYETIPLADMIEQGVPNVTRKTDLETCIFMGEIKAFITPVTVDDVTFATYYPYSCNDIYPDFGIPPSSSEVTRFETWALSDFMNYVPGSYRLENIVNTYVLNSYFDTTKEYVMQMEDNPFLSTSFLFEINNAIYIPLRFERTISDKPEMVTGYFYKML
ncbi:MAG: hypothetical protein A2W86_11920 [Bacteroidetes bacterium GWD2_45_23]|nr:MAG: hypothetical protein A2W87_08095 [Bacteroidetes bacterium GWC2_46_850]OFX85528.1 MAG: hypothetical protein A2W86_11920 [Bacteroidetes bacterium GWD2_45_23]HBB00755.1 hypothetical protein [Porphyromonadaceae bacterium]HCC19380.1 hypothetical protein [Porphyromonadaceae bacterium]